MKLRQMLAIGLSAVTMMSAAPGGGQHISACRCQYASNK